MNNKQESVEDYLEKILMLKEHGSFVRAIDLAEKMEFSKPSVSIALKKMKAEGLVNVDESTGEIDLTSKGKELATNVYQRHRVISGLFILLGVDEQVALKDACKIEHDLSEESFEALQNLYQKLKK